MTFGRLILRRSFLTGIAMAGFLAASSQAAEPVGRIVTLTSLTADIVYRLNPKLLVGVPAGSLIESDPRLNPIQSIGLGNGPNLEQIVALKPNLVLGASGFHDSVAEMLKTSGINTLLTEVDSWSSLVETTQQIAQATLQSEEQLIKEYNRFKPTAISSDLKVLLLAGQQPILSPNKNSWAGNLIDQYGVQNITAELQGEGQFRGYVTLSAEKVIEYNPDILLVVNPEESDPLEFFESRSYWKSLRAVQNKQVYAFDYYGLVNPGSWEKIKAACEKLDNIFTTS